jgi:hypothetical protein
MEMQFDGRDLNRDGDSLDILQISLLLQDSLSPLAVLS